MLVVELELVLVLRPGLEIVVVVEDMGEVRRYHMPCGRLEYCFYPEAVSLLG